MMRFCWAMLLGAFILSSSGFAGESPKEVWARRTLLSVEQGIAAKNAELNKKWFSRMRALDLKQARDVQRLIIPRATLSSDRKFLRGLIAGLEASDLSSLKIQIERDTRVLVLEADKQILIESKDQLAGLYQINGHAELRVGTFKSWEGVYEHLVEAQVPAERAAWRWPGFAIVPEAQANRLSRLGPAALVLVMLGNGEPDLATDFRGDARRAHENAVESCRNSFTAGERELRALRPLSCPEITNERLGWSGGMEGLAAARRAIAIARDPGDLFYCANQARRRLYEHCASAALKPIDHERFFRRAEGMCREIQSVSQRCPMPAALESEAQRANEPEPAPSAAPAR